MGFHIITGRCSFSGGCDIRVTPVRHVLQVGDESRVRDAHAAGQQPGQVAGGGGARGQRARAQAVQPGRYLPQVVQDAVRTLLVY